MTEKENKKMLAATLFPIDGLSDIPFKFRILRVREKMPEDNRKPIQIQKWADTLWKKYLKCPVYPTQRFGYPAFLIPDDRSPNEGCSFEMLGVPDRMYHIDVTRDVIEIDIGNAQVPERELICRMIERPFSDKLFSMKDTFWREQWNLFYFKESINSSVSSDLTNAYRGYKFSVVIAKDNNFYLAIDSKTRYIGRKSLSDYSTDERKEILFEHLDTTRKYVERAKFLRDNGIKKIPCKYAGESEETVGQFTIPKIGKTVLEYYQQEYPDLRIDFYDPVIYVEDREGSSAWPVPSSRLFPIFTTEYDEVKRCSIQPQMTPTQRYGEIRNFLTYLNDIKYGSTPIVVRDNILIDDRNVFIPPSLEFGNSTFLQPFTNQKYPSYVEEFDGEILKYGKKKLYALSDNGPYHNEPIPGIILLYPSTIDRPTRERFIEHIKKEIDMRTRQKVQITNNCEYAIGDKEKQGISLITLAKKLQSEGQRCLFVVILWDRLNRNIYSILKDILQRMPSQFVWENTLRDICSEDNPRRSMSLLRHLSLGIITEAGIKPWVIAEDLHHDLHIGIDILYGRIDYRFLYGKGGRIIKSESGHAIERGRTQEAIKKSEIRNQLVRIIKSIVDEGFSIQNISIHRDGRWWPSESNGLREALNILKEERILPEKLKCAVVEIRKDFSKPIRLFSCTIGNELKMQNPLPGTYLILDSYRIILATTGRPGAWDYPGGKTARTLLLEIVEKYGETDIREIASDVYSLTHLNWSAPDIFMRLPATLQWSDKALRETLIYSEEEDSEYLKETEVASSLEDELQ